jgi:hypothetical protein
MKLSLHEKRVRGATKNEQPAQTVERFARAAFHPPESVDKWAARAT